MNSTTEKSNFQIYNASAGSGKTFTLVLEYLKILFQTKSNYNFKNILAITFTNKAAAEMKARILESLQEFANPDIINQDNALFNKICKELDIEPVLIQSKATKIIKNILNNYAAFNITTIDSFTYKLIRGFAFDLGISLNFEIEMDAESLLNEAVDILISRIGEDKLLTKTLIDFSILKSSEDKSWDISFDLKEIAKLLLNENDILQVEKIKRKPIIEFIELQKKINEQLRSTEIRMAEIGEEAMYIIKDAGLISSDFSNQDLPRHFDKLINFEIDLLNFEGRLAKNIYEEHHQYSGKADRETKRKIDAVRDDLVDLFFESRDIYSVECSAYFLNKLIRNSLIPLAILRTINNVLTEIKEDNNIRLISEFNQIISKHLREQPAAFIYEKIGERFRHYFIDEMQDTSILQWENLHPLLEHVLSSENVKEEKGSLLLVGDAKQAIYRWRGGKAEQFIELATEKGQNLFNIEKNINLLDTNWRSYSKVIGFNNSFFQYIAKFLKNDTYRKLYEDGNKQKENPKKGGYVEIQFIPDKLNAEEKLEVYPAKVLEIIRSLGEFDLKDICILTRTRKQGVAIAEYLIENQVEIISSESLLLQNSPKVTFIINLLYFINNPKDKEILFEILYFLHLHFEIENDKHTYFDYFLNVEEELFFNELQRFEIEFDLNYFRSLSLYENIEYIIRQFRLTLISDAYIQFFLDVILKFSLKKNEGLEAFLSFWEEKKDKLSIVVPSEKDAVHIMTIHKAKGLEFPVVIYPFDLNMYYQITPKVWYTNLDRKQYNGFDSTLVNYNKSLQKIGYAGEELYAIGQEELELDNFNLLYVALTRAEEQLYIISEHREEPKEGPKYYSHLFTGFLQSKGEWVFDKSIYHFGNKKRISKKEESIQNNLEQTTFISSDWRQHNINIVPTIETEDSKREEAKNFGNLMHQILEKITTHADFSVSLQSFINKGLIAKENKELIASRIEKTIYHSELYAYYTENFKIKNEREILTSTGEIIIPDRLVFSGKNVIVIDYKTGNPEKSHQYQINNYADVLSKMGFVVVKKLLVYIDEEVEVISVAI